MFSNQTSGQASLETTHPYRYFVSYQYKVPGGMGFGMTELMLAAPVTSIETVAAMGEYIGKDVGSVDGSVVIVNFQLLSGPQAPVSDRQPVAAESRL